MDSFSRSNWSRSCFSKAFSSTIRRLWDRWLRCFGDCSIHLFWLATSISPFALINTWTKERWLIHEQRKVTLFCVPRGTPVQHTTTRYYIYL
jgi:hypothetical protein